MHTGDRAWQAKIRVTVSGKQKKPTEGEVMVVEMEGEKYRCSVCGNEVVVTVVGGGTLVCCGEEMEKIYG